MPKGWLIVVIKGSQDEPEAEHYIVALSDRDQAIQKIRSRVGGEAKVLAFGEAPTPLMAFLNAKRGDVFSTSQLYGTFTQHRPTPMVRNQSGWIWGMPFISPQRPFLVSHPFTRATTTRRATKSHWWDSTK